MNPSSFRHARSSTAALVGDLLPAAFAAVVSGTSAAVVVAGADGTIVSWNSAAEEIFGWSADEAVGQPVALLTSRRRDGSGVDVATTTTRLLDADGVERGTVLIADPATDPYPDLVTRSFDLLARASEMVTVVDADGIVIYVSPEVLRLRGIAPERVIGRDALDSVHPADREMVDAARLRVLASPDEHPVVVYRSIGWDGARRWSESTFSNLLDDPMIGGIVVNVRDVTQRELALNAVVAQENRIAAILARSSDVAMMFAPDGIIHWASPAIIDVFGHDPAALIGTSGYDLIHPDDRDRVVGVLRSAMEGDREHVTVEFRLIDGHGAVRWVEEVATDLTDDDAVGYVVANLRDITARKQADRRLRRLALFDPLTGLPNRNHLVSRLKERLHATSVDSRHGLVFFDVDGFRDLNDTLGHVTGDELLISIAHRVQRALSPRTLLARCGGDEFGIVCDDAAEVDELVAIADVVHGALAEPFLVDGSEVYVSVSAGVASALGADATTLIRQADDALWRAKDAGRGRTAVFDQDLHDHAQKRITYGNDLHHAVERGEIVPEFQPVVHLATGKVIAVEALARWTHPERGPVPPDLFIPAAETTGLITEIGAGVLADSCRAAADWLRRGRWVQLAVNASAVQLMDPSFADRVSLTLAATGLSATQLTIEITETAALRDLDAALLTLNALRRLGVQTSLDDFGTGYSSLSLLKSLPIDAIKIDRSFVSGVGVRAEDEKIVAAVVGLGLTLGLHVVAEGVETAEQADGLRSMGCEFGQGWLWSKAVPADRLMDVADGIEAR